MRHISEILDTLFDDIDAIVKPGRHPSSSSIPQYMGIATGFAELDSMTAGFQRSDLIVVAGSSSIGKTSLILCMAYGIALTNEKNVAIFSHELSSTQVQHRFLSIDTGIDVLRIARGQISDDEWTRLARAYCRLRDSSIHIDDSISDIAEIRAKSLRLRSQQGLDMIIIDPLTLIPVPEAFDRSLRLTFLSRELKKLARDLNVPIVTTLPISVLRSDSQPLLCDLSFAGSVDEIADLILFLDREELRDSTSDKKGVAEIIVAKHRNGPVGSVNLRFFDRTARFADLELYPGPGM